MTYPKPPPQHTILLATIATLVWLAGCDDAPTRSTPDASMDAPGDADGALDDTTPETDEPTPDGQPTGVELTLAVHAVDTCGSWQPQYQPGLSYQTPSNLRIGVMSVALLRSHRDTEPQALTLPEPVVEADATAGNMFLTVNTSTISEGTYSHIRVGLAYSIYEVQATAHTTVDVPGTLEMDMALSTHETPDGALRSQGQYNATFSAFGQSTSMPGMTPLNCVLSAWGGIAATVGSDFLVTVPIPGGPVIVDHASVEPIAIDLEFPMRDAFTWRDLDEPGFAEGVLDLAQPPGSVELPDSLVECHLLMADRCQGEAVVPVHPTWPMSDSSIDFCSDGQQIVAACPGPDGPAYGQDANYTVNPPLFEVRDGVVHDQVTGLSWQRAVPAETYDWWEAREICAELELGGHTDWRLPSRIELVSLLDFGELDPTIDLSAFPGTPSDFFWSASPVPFLNLAYGVRFELGFIYDHDPHGSGRVRCVRGAYEAPEQRFDAGSVAVVDSTTGLTWQRQHLLASTWMDALAACEQLDLAGHDDWRLPTLKELQTIVDERRLQPSIDVVAFPDTPSEWFWSSTPIQFPPNEGWATSFTDGYASIHAFAELHLVRCVRQTEE